MLKTHRYWLGLFWLVTILVLPLPLIQTMTDNLATIYSSESLAINLGIIAYVWMLFELLIATRPAWIERVIGLPEMYFVHGIIGIAAIVLAYVHKIMSSSNGWAAWFGNIALDILIAVAIYSIFFLSGWLTDRVRWAKLLKDRLEKVFRHEISVWLHRLNVLATGFVFIHVILISYISSILPFMILFYLYTLIAFGSYFWTKYRNVFRGIHGRVVLNEALSSTTQKISIELRRSHKLKYQSGDYIFISLPKRSGMHEPHPFSILNVANQSGLIELMIRKDGDWTSKVPTLKIGETVKIIGLAGTLRNMVENESAGKPLVLLAGGSGIPPMMSLATEYLHQGRQIYLLWTVHHESDLVFRDELAQLKLEFPESFTYQTQVGRFTVRELERLLVNVDNNKYYLLSGPNVMMISNRRELRQLGVAKTNIYFEKFSF